MINVNFKVGQLAQVWRWVDVQWDIGLIIAIEPNLDQMDAHVFLLIGEEIESYFYSELKPLDEVG